MTSGTVLRQIKRSFLNPEVNRGHYPTTALSNSHDTRILFAAGSHTVVGTTLMTGVYHLLRNPEAKRRVVDKVRGAWPDLDEAPPSYEELEKLPFLASAFLFPEPSLL